MEETTPSLELRDIPDVTPLLPHDWLPWWVWVAMAVVLLLLWFIISRARKSKQDPSVLRLKAYQEALHSLESARSLQSAVALATSLSLTLRRYLAIAFGDPSLFETHEEFLARHNALDSLPVETRQLLTSHFSTLCRFKYAPSDVAVDLSLLVPQATDLLNRLHAAPVPSLPAAS
jgi:hypothetical protein